MEKKEVFCPCVRISPIYTNAIRKRRRRRWKKGSTHNTFSDFLYPQKLASSSSSSPSFRPRLPSPSLSLLARWSGLPLPPLGGWGGHRRPMLYIRPRLTSLGLSRSPAVVRRQPPLSALSSYSSSSCRRAVTCACANELRLQKNISRLVVVDRELCRHNSFKCVRVRLPIIILECSLDWIAKGPIDFIPPLEKREREKY